MDPWQSCSVWPTASPSASPPGSTAAGCFLETPPYCSHLWHLHMRLPSPVWPSTQWQRETERLRPQWWCQVRQSQRWSSLNDWWRTCLPVLVMLSKKTSGLYSCFFSCRWTEDCDHFGTRQPWSRGPSKLYVLGWVHSIMQLHVDLVWENDDGQRHRHHCEPLRFPRVHQLPGREHVHREDGHVQRDPQCLR